MLDVIISIARPPISCGLSLPEMPAQVTWARYITSPPSVSNSTHPGTMDKYTVPSLLGPGPGRAEASGLLVSSRGARRRADCGLLMARDCA